MLQTFLTKPCTIQLAHTSKPDPRKGDVLIRLSEVGICGSDIHLFNNGHQHDGPLTIGHEGIGVIERVGEGIDGQRVGQRVVIEPNIPCFNCPECRKGRGNVCRNKRIIGVNENGCFAEYIALPGDFAHPLSVKVSDTDAVTIEPATVALAALKRSRAKPGDTIAVIGLGAIGMLLTHIATSLGYKVLVAELVEAKIKRAVEMGAHCVQGGASLKETASMYESLFEKEDVVTLFECAGSRDSATLAVESAPRGADIILLGLSKEKALFNPWLISRKGNRIIPSLIYDHPFDFRRCMRLIEQGTINPGSIISSYIKLEELEHALDKAQGGEETKIVIRISD